jgi:hypothetical protein
MLLNYLLAKKITNKGKEESGDTMRENLKRQEIVQLPMRK